MSKQTERIEGSLLPPDLNESLEKKRTRATIEQALAMSRIADSLYQISNQVTQVEVRGCIDTAQ